MAAGQSTDIRRGHRAANSQNGPPKLDHRYQGELAGTGEGRRVFGTSERLAQPDDKDRHIGSILDINECLTDLGVDTRLRRITGAA